MRADIPPGLQLAQTAHAAIAAALRWPAPIREWNLESNNVVVVAVPDEPALISLARLARVDLDVVVFHEPDLGDEATAIALEPGTFARRLCSSYPLAGKEPVH